MRDPCFVEDEFVRWKPRWVARLTDDALVYQDDDRSDGEDSSAWDRLRVYCQDRRLRIKEFRLQFRSHIVNVSLDGSGLYCSRSAFGFWGVNQTFAGYWVGAVKDGESILTHYKSPELIPLESQHQEISEDSRHVILTER